MYINHIKIENYRNFSNFEMDFHDGLNVIVGSNNSGKTGLLRAINLINSPNNISIDDFNKSNLQEHYNNTYKDVPPEIIIEYQIYHQISEENTADESIIKLISFLGMDKIEESKKEVTDTSIYTLVACVQMKYALNSKEIGRYLELVSVATTFEKYYEALKLCQKNYSWTYTNGISDTSVDKKEATGIFKIDFIEAERKSESIYDETKKAINDFMKNDENSVAIQKMQQEISDMMKTNINPVLSKIETVIGNENNDIGLAKGNVAILQDIRPNASISESYILDVKDTKADYIVPLSHNGLGYNNLINMYMLIKLVEIQKGKDFRILCLEEPEAHLHPAMQYKLFKFLKKIDDDDNLNQQIFVTTHSANITAVAGLDNMFMLSYDRTDNQSDCKQQSLQKQFENEENAKNHMMKFLDVTRSDMLFADKVILVEGIAEKLLLPKFMDKCSLSYEDEHISIIEIGGKHFSHFIKVFANNPVNKKVLCITDKDYTLLKEKDDGSQESELKRISQYITYVPPHVKKLRNEFKENTNIKVMSQLKEGRTFEDELFISNFQDETISCNLLKIALGKTFYKFIDKNKCNFNNWKNNHKDIDGRSKKKVMKLIKLFSEAIDKHPTDYSKYEKLFFAVLFLKYSEDKKGDVALQIIVNEDLLKLISVPKYIQGGLKWLSK